MLGVHNIMRSKHKKQCLKLSFMTDRQVNSHLIAVEIGIESCCYQWMQLNCFPFNQARLECLDTKSVQSRSTIEHHWMTINHLLQNIPNFIGFSFNQFLGALHCFDMSSFNQFANDERLEQFNSHIFWKTTFMNLQFRTNNDNGTT